MTKSKSEKFEPKNVGGMALMEGVMMKSDIKSVCAVRKADGSIEVVDVEGGNFIKNTTLKKIPIVRGLFAFLDSLVTGMKAMYQSALDIDIESDSEGEEDSNLNSFEIGISFIIAIALSIGLFIFIPNFVSNLFFPIANVANKGMYNLTEGILKFVMFFGYVILISKMEEIQKTFRYHGAEHKCIMCYESGKKLTVANVKKASRFHPRCGTSFILIVFIVSVIVGYFIYFPNVWLKIATKILMLPFIAGISYEFIRFANKKDNIFTKLIKAPGLMTQRLTTKEPTEKQIEVGIASIEAALELEAEKSMKDYIAELIKKYEISISDLVRIIAKELKVNKDKILLDITTIKLKYVECINIENAVKRYKKDNIPLQYILGTQSFYGLDFRVEKGILVPRPDTEILVEEAIIEIDKKEYKSAIDMCTGSGCIGISIAKNSSIKNVTMVDISDIAIKVANENIIANEVDKKCQVVKSNLFEKLNKRKKVDCIFSNPPYIKTWDISTLDEVVKNEPKLALDGGDDGLDFYRKIISEARSYLKENGMLILEIGYDQAAEVKKILRQYKEYKNIKVIKDYGDNERVVKCHFHKI